MFEALFAHAGLSLERLRSFAEIVSAGGISAAAGDDSNRQSQLSRQLKELERYFGVELIKRGRGPMKLTPAGKHLYQLINHALGGLQTFRQDCADQPVDLVIGAGESLIQWLLLPRLAPLLAGHPRLKLTLENRRTEEILDGLVEGTLDFGVVGRLIGQPEIASAPLGSLEYALFVPDRLLAQRRLPAKPDSKILENLPLALLSGSEGIRTALEAEARKHRFSLNVRLHFSSYPQLAQAVQALSVAAIMPTLAEALLPAGRVQGLRLPCLNSLSRRLVLAWNRKLAEVRPAISTFSKVLAGVFRCG